MAFKYCFYFFEQTTAQNGQQAAMHVQMNHGEFSSDLTELSHADLNGLVSEIDDGEGDDIFKQFGNFELDNIFAEFDEKVLKLIKQPNPCIFKNYNCLLFQIQVGDCSTLLAANPMESTLSISVADDYLRKRLAKRSFHDDHREVQKKFCFRTLCLEYI